MNNFVKESGSEKNFLWKLLLEKLPYTKSSRFIVVGMIKMSIAMSGSETWE